MIVCQRCTNVVPTAFLIMGCDLNGCLDVWIHGIYRDNVLIWKCFLCCWPSAKSNVQKDNDLSLGGAKPLSELTLVYIVNRSLANKLY